MLSSFPVHLVSLCHLGTVEKGPTLAQMRDLKCTQWLQCFFFSPKDIFSITIALGLLPDQGKCLADLTWVVATPFPNSTNKEGKVSHDLVL